MEPIRTSRFPQLQGGAGSARGYLIVLACALLLTLTSLLPGATAAESSPAISYRVSFENRAHHEARIEIRISDLATETLDMRMSRSSPGRYRLHEFVRNVYSVEARNSAGQRLEIEQQDAHGWSIRQHDGVVVFSYTLFGDLISGTYTSIDEYQAHLNIPASFAWPRGLEQRPIEVTFDLPDGWQIASQLPAGERADTVTAPNLEYFLDSPIGLGPFEWVTWESALHSGADGAVQTFQLALQRAPDLPAAETKRLAQQYARWAERVALEQAAVFGGFPAFDFGTYTFIAKYLPWADGDAMEHRNSTILASPRDLEGSGLDLLHTLSHEFFHVWNVERIRPVSLQPFDFEKAAFSDLLWFSEGFTNYYDKLSLVRSGLYDRQRYLSMVERNLEAYRATPAVHYGGPIEMSRRAAFHDRGVWRDRLNATNTYHHYYFYGETLALALDLELRRDHDATLDLLMRSMWRDFGRQEKPFTLDDLENALAGISTADFARSFFDRFIRGSERPDWPELLAFVGLERVPLRPGSGWIGSGGFETSGLADTAGVEITIPTRRGQPLYEAGLDRGDVIMTVDGQRTSSRERLLGILEDEARIGQAVEVVYRTRSGRKRATLRIEQDPSLQLVRSESLGKPLSRQARSAREEWLASRQPSN